MRGRSSALSRGWCCAWIQEVQRKAAEGKIICCAVSNIYASDARLSPCQVVSIFHCFAGGLNVWPVACYVLRNLIGLPCAALAAELWVDAYRAGSSELSDARAEEFGLRKRLGHGHVSLVRVGGCARS